jgi:hypothetical protein
MAAAFVNDGSFMVRICVVNSDYNKSMSLQEQMKKMMEQQEKEKEAADAGESIKEEAVQSYIASAKYSGSKAGFIFQKVRSSRAELSTAARSHPPRICTQGPKGVGYYPDPILKGGDEEDKKGEEAAAGKKRSTFPLL